MAVTVQPEVLDDIKRYGAFDISACFHCGNCTAVCPLSDQAGSFPRKLIRLGQIGDRKRLASSPEVWLCYYCGECSETCPRQAEPGEYMAALRRYAIAAAEPTGLARLMYKSIGFSLLVTLLVGIVLGMFLLARPAESQNLPHIQAWMFNLVPYETIHNMGIAVFAIAGLTILAGFGRTLRSIWGGPDGKGPGKASFADLRRALAWTFKEIALMSRHREEADSAAASLPAWLRASVAHRLIMYGFTALLLATTLDFVFITLLPLGLVTFWPARIIGILGGIAMMVGVVGASWRRIRKLEKNVARSAFADWWVLFFLFVLGVTGFWLTGVVTVRPEKSVAYDIVLLVHAAMAMELVLMLAFTKMAHMLYRPLALLVYRLKTQPQA